MKLTRQVEKEFHKKEEIYVDWPTGRGGPYTQYIKVEEEDGIYYSITIEDKTFMVPYGDVINPNEKTFENGRLVKLKRKSTNIYLNTFDEELYGLYFKSDNESVYIGDEPIHEKHLSDIEPVYRKLEDIDIFRLKEKLDSHVNKASIHGVYKIIYEFISGEKS